MHTEKRLEGVAAAILVADGYEDSELESPREALVAAGARVAVISPSRGTVKGKERETKVDLPLSDARPDEFQALVLPGGVKNPDTLRTIPEAVEFVRHFVVAGKPIASICHGPWTLIEAGAVKGRTMTSWPSLKTDLKNAGAKWLDREVVVDRGLVTSRKPDDLPAFNAKMIEEFAEGVHAAATGPRGEKRSRH